MMVPARICRPVSSLFLQSRVKYHHKLRAVRSISSQVGAASCQFLIQIPDLPGVQDKRSRTKEVHIKDCTPLIDSGKLSYFGVTLAEHSKEGGIANINGSVMVLEAEDEAAVWDFLRRDAYAQAGVWDVKKAKIWPFKSG